MTNKHKKLNNQNSTMDNFQIYTNRSGNSWYPRNYFYNNGIRSDAFGRIPGDPGFQPFPSPGTQYFPITYSPNQAIPIYPSSAPRKGPKKSKRYPGLSNLSSSQNLNLEKQKIQNSVDNLSRQRIFNNKRNKWDRRNHYSFNYPPTPRPPPNPSIQYIIPTVFTKAYFTFDWANVPPYSFKFIGLNGSSRYPIPHYNFYTFR